MIKGLLPVVDAELGFNFVAAQNFIKRLIAQHIDDDFKNFYKFIVSRIKEDNFINTQHGFEMIGELISFSYSEIKEANIPFFRTVDDLEVLMTALAKVEIATNHGPFSIVSDYTLDRKAFALKLNKRFDWDSFINFCFEDDKFKDGLLDFSKC